MIAHYNNLNKIQIQDSKFRLYIKKNSKKILMYCSKKFKTILFRYLIIA